MGKPLELNINLNNPVFITKVSECFKTPNPKDRTITFEINHLNLVPKLCYLKLKKHTSLWLCLIFLRKIKKSKIKNIRVSLNQTIKKYHYENYK